jgi:hypothetical protein
MVDLEHCLAEEGISHGYRFDQTDSVITLYFPIPPGIERSGIDFELSGDDNSFFAGVPGVPASICGVMFDAIHRHEITYSRGQCRIKLHKTKRSIWQIFIRGRSIRGIDPKSLFMLGVYDDACARPRAAWLKFEESANLGYVPAKFLMATTLLNDGNPYHVSKDELRGVAILDSIPAEYLTPQIRMVHFDALLRVGEPDRARIVLSEAALTSSDARLRLVHFLDKLPDPDGAIERELIAHLETLVGENYADACLALAQRYITGKGVQKDSEVARQLAARAHELDPNLPETVEAHDGMASVPMVIATVSLVLLGFALSVGFVRKRK